MLSILLVLDACAIKAKVIYSETNDLTGNKSRTENESGDGIMAKNGWYEAGDRIKNLVQDAVESGDYSQLGSAISCVVNETVDTVSDVMNEAARTFRNSEHGANQSGRGQYANDRHQRVYDRHQYTRDRRQYTNSEAADQIRRNIEELRRRRQQEHQRETEQRKDRMQRPVQVKLRVPGEISGNIMKWFGYSMSGVFGLSFGIVTLTGFVYRMSGFAVVAGILGLLFGVNLCIGAGGSKRAGQAKRFRRYNAILGERTYCLVEELAAAIGQSCRFVQRDLKRMIAKGFFAEGYLDRKETLLMTDRETYQQYLTTQAEYERGAIGRSTQEQRIEAEQPKMAEQERAAQAPETDSSRKSENLSPKCRELIREGENYIRHIHECNVKIEDKEMSDKLDRLELVITRIFREAEKDPAVVDDLKKMMSYYLPTTRKLLDAYCEMDAQPISGQNIESTKKEIENALDTINGAFERLLDSFFEEKAWDISSDISVLNTMFAQEGLTGKDFAK